MTAAGQRGGGDHTVELALPPASSFNAVGRLVVGGLASRLDLPVQEIEDLQLAVEALLCRPAADASVALALTASDDGLRATIGPFVRAPRERARLVSMLDSLVDDAVVQDSGEAEWVVMRAAGRPAARGSS